MALKLSTQGSDLRISLAYLLNRLIHVVLHHPFDFVELVLDYYDFLLVLADLVHTCLEHVLCLVNVFFDIFELFLALCLVILRIRLHQGDSLFECHRLGQCNLHSFHQGLDGF